jgi:hypothetical protein
VKKSNSTQSSGLLKTLNSAIVSANHKQEVSLSVSYVFVQKKAQNIHAHTVADMGTQEIKGMLHTKLNGVALENKSPDDVLKMLHGMKHDVGADYFLVN